MKLALATLALAQANEDDRAFVNVDGFMSSSPPSWWNKHSADKRIEWLGNTWLNTFFDVYFNDNYFNENDNPLRPLFADYVADMKAIEAACTPARKRREDNRK